MKTSWSKPNCLMLLGGLFIGVFLAYIGLVSKPAAAVSNNQTINFQGRLLNSQGATVPDGFYNIQFKIYQDGDGQSAGDTTGSPAGSLKWTEDYLNQASHGVKVVNGFMSVQLGSLTAFGSNIDWNQGNLWLSMNIAGTGAACTPFSSCSPDGEMLPMQPLTASPYSLNSGELNGLTSSSFVQLAQGVQTDASTASSIFINKTGSSGSILELQKGGVDVMNVSNTGTLLLKPTVDSATALQVQNHANGYSVFSVDTSGNAVVLGQASSLTGKLQLATAGGGTLTISPTSSASSFTITFPGETGTVCTTATSGVCNTAGGLSNVAYLNQDQSFTGKNTFSRNGSGSNDYSVGITGTPGASSSSSLVRIGSALTGGNGAANGGTYVSIVEPSSGAGSAADFLNLQNGSTVELQLSSAGNLSIGGTYNGNTFDNSGHLTFGNAGAATISSNASGANNLTVDTGNSGATLALGNTAGTTNIGTSNAAHTIGIGTGGGGTTTQAVTIGAATNSSSTLTLQGGSAGTAITLQTGNNGTTAGSIQIGNTSGAFGQTISIGTNNNAANIVNLGTGTAQDNVTIGDNTNASSSVSLKAGSTGGISLGANTTLSANSNFTYASGSGKFDASNATGTFDTSTGINHLNGATTVTGTNTFTVNGGATTLNGASAGNGTAAKINTNAASNLGVVIQGASSQTAGLLQLQDSTGAVMLGVSANGDLDSIGYYANQYAGLGNYGNLLVQSEQLGTTWSASGITVTQNDAGSNPSPDGNTTADKLVATASGTHNLTQTYSSAGNNTYTFSIWLKTNGGSDTAQLRIDSNGTPATGTVKTFAVTTSWQRVSITQVFTSGVTTVTPTLILNNNTVVAGWGAQLEQGGSAGTYTRTGSSIVSASNGIVNNQSALFQNLNNSATAYQFLNASGANVATVDTSGGQVVLGGGAVSGQLKFNYGGQTGSVTLQVANPSSTSYTITLPAETGTICTTASAGACSAAGSGYVQLAPNNGTTATAQSDATNYNSIFINKTSGTGNILELQKSAGDVFKVDNTGNVTSTGQNTLSRNSSGSNDYSFGVTGTPAASSSSSLVRLGSALTGGNGAVNGGTYLSIVEPSSGAGSAADFLDLQNGSTVELQLSSAGNLTVGGTYNGNTFDNAGHLTFGNSGAATISSNGAAANNLTVDTGNSGATLILGNTAGTTNISTSNAAHTISIGTGGGGTTTQAITIGAATNSSSSLTLQGGSAGTTISLITGNNGTTAGSIQIGNTTGGFGQTVSIGSNSTASSSNTVSIGTGTVQDSVTIGDTTNSASSVNIKGGSSGGVTLTASTTNINSATVATNQSTIAVFNSPTNVTTYQAGTSISIGATSGTLSVRNANTTLGNAAGSGLFTNNGATLNSTLALGDFPTGGAISASPTTSVDIYTSISIAQTTGSQALTIPSPTASTTYGRVIYLSNIGTASFTLGGIRIPPGDTATMMWSHTNGGDSWQFAGAGASSIENQNTNDQSADFRINGTGRANTSFVSPLFDSITGGLSLGTSTATGVTIGGTTNTTSVLLQGAASATYTIGTSANTGGITVGNSTASNTISIGGAQTATGNTQTVNVGTLATGTGKAVVTIGNTNGASSVTIQAGSGGITLSGATTVSGSNTFATGTGTVSLNGDTTVASGKELALGGNGSDLTCTNGAIFYRSDTNRFRGCENGSWIYIDNYSDVRSYTSGDNTWSMPTNAATVEVILIGAGGGGGGGGARNGGQERNGGGGGGGGDYATQVFAASDLPSSAHASVGGTGSSGAGAASSATAGSNGGAGGTSCFSSAASCTGTIYLQAFGGGGGGGGNQSAAAGGGGGGGGGAGAAGSTGSNASNTGANGGGPAGGAANTSTSGGAGAGGGTSGSATVNAGNAGGAAEYGGGGGGGAGGGNSASGNGGSSVHGAGGGGAGASTNSGNSTGNSGAGGVSTSITSGGGGTAGPNSACPGGAGGNGGSGNSIKSGSGGGGGGANGGGGAAGCNGGNGGAPGGGGGGGGSGSTSAGNGGTGGAGEIWIISW